MKLHLEVCGISINLNLGLYCNGSQDDETAVNLSIQLSRILGFGKNKSNILLRI